MDVSAAAHAFGTRLRVAVPTAGPGLLSRRTRASVRALRRRAAAAALRQSQAGRGARAGWLRAGADRALHGAGDALRIRAVLRTSSDGPRQGRCRGTRPRRAIATPDADPEWSVARRDQRNARRAARRAACYETRWHGPDGRHAVGRGAAAPADATVTSLRPSGDTPAERVAALARSGRRRGLLGAVGLGRPRRDRLRRRRRGDTRRPSRRARAPRSSALRWARRGLPTLPARTRAQARRHPPSRRRARTDARPTVHGRLAPPRRRPRSEASGARLRARARGHRRSGPRAGGRSSA